MSNNKDPAFLFYPTDFLVGVSDLTMEERGQYITLMCLQHTKGHLSKKNMQISVGTVSKDVLSKFSIDENGLYYNERLEKEIEKRKSYCEKQSQNIKKRWEKRNTTEYTVVLPTNIPSENEIGNIIENITDSDNKKYSNTSTSPTYEQVEEYAISKNRSDLARPFYDYYTEGNWHDSEGKKVKNWKQKFITWCSKNPIKPTEQKQEDKYPIIGVML